MHNSVLLSPKCLASTVATCFYYNHYTRMLGQSRGIAFSGIQYIWSRNTSFMLCKVNIPVNSDDISVP